MLGKLKKLKGKSFAELKDRGRQAASAYAERAGFSRQAVLPSDEALLAMFGGGFADTNELFDHFKTRPNERFYASFDTPEVAADILKVRFADESVTLIERANKIVSGRFDLLGCTDLDFGSPNPNWHFDPISGKTSPRLHWSRIDEIDPHLTGDKKVIWELNRHQYFTTLGRAYWLTGDEKYAETFAVHLADWFENNPPKIGVNWLSSLEIAFRSNSWIWAFYFFRNSNSLRLELFVRMLKFLYLNGRHLETYLSTHFSPNTHLTGEAFGLYLLGSFMPEHRDAARWRELGHSILMSALNFQVRDDGVYCEQASQYHRYTADIYLNFAILKRRAGLQTDELHAKKLNGLLDFLLHIQQPNGETPLIGDDDGGRFNFLDERQYTDFRPTLSAGAVLFERSDLKFAAGDASSELFWLFGVERLKKFDGLACIEPENRSKAFTDGGFYTFRTTWNCDADLLLIDCGPHGFLNCGHAHADVMSFLLNWQGVPLFVDSGTYNYTSNADARRLFRSSSAHNCLTVNGNSSSEPGGPFSWKRVAESRVIEWRVEDDEVCFRGTHNGYERFGVKYEREIRYAKGLFSVCERIDSDRVNFFQTSFILSPNVEAELENGRIRLFIKSARREEIATLEFAVEGEKIEDEAAWKIEPWQISPRYGAKTNSKRLVLTFKGSGRISAEITVARSK